MRLFKKKIKPILNDDDLKIKKKHSQETKNKISRGNKGKIRSPEFKLRLSISQKGKTPWNKGLNKETDERVMKYSNKHKGFKMTEFQKIKLKEANKGQIPWIKGKKHTKETIVRMKENHNGNTGKNLSKEHKEKLRKFHKDKILSEETKEKIRKNSWIKGKKRTYNSIMKGIQTKKIKGYIVSEETKRKIGIANSIALRGRKLSKETIKKMSESKRGEKSHFWKGGISFEPYDLRWNNKFKNKIRERDNQICMNCGIHREKMKNALNVHHINYNKKLSLPENCVSLCNRCHSITNGNRKYWIDFFQSILSEKYKYEYSKDKEINIIMNKEDLEKSYV